MDSLNIVINEDNSVEIKNETEMSFGTALGLCIDGLECLLSHGVSALDEDVEQINNLHDYTSYSLSSVMERCFPESEDFSFTDAALYKAQNDLIEESMEKGVPLEDLIQQYNEEAKSYLENIRKEN